MVLSQYDLNTCTARHLTCIPGIDKALADAVIRFRNSHQGFNHFDELWRVTGMSRSKFALLKKHFKVTGQKVPGMGAPLPYERLTITESMMQFLCNGQNLKTTGICLKGRSPSTSPPSRRSPGVRDRPPAPRVKRVPSREKPWVAGNPSIPAKRLQRCNLSICNSGGGTRIPLFKTNASSPSSSPTQKPGKDANITNPAVTVRPSASGNNINVSCTFDSRLLKLVPEEKDDSDQTKPAAKPPEAQEEQAGADTKAKQQRTDKYNAPGTRQNQQKKTLDKLDCFVSNAVKNGPNKGRPSSDESTVSEYVTASPPGQKKDAGTPCACTGRSLLLHDSSTSGSSSEMSQENVLVYERTHRLSPAEHKIRLNNWVLDVNEARNLERYARAHGKERPTHPMCKVTSPRGDGIGLRPVATYTLIPPSSKSPKPTGTCQGGSGVGRTDIKAGGKVGGKTPLPSRAAARACSKRHYGRWDGKSKLAVVLHTVDQTSVRPKTCPGPKGRAGQPCGTRDPACPPASPTKRARGASQSPPITRRYHTTHEYSYYPCSKEQKTVSPGPADRKRAKWQETKARGHSHPLYRRPIKKSPEAKTHMDSATGDNACEVQ